MINIFIIITIFIDHYNSNESFIIMVKEILILIIKQSKTNKSRSNQFNVSLTTKWKYRLYNEKRIHKNSIIYLISITIQKL